MPVGSSRDSFVRWRAGCGGGLPDRRCCRRAGRPAEGPLRATRRGGTDRSWWSPAVTRTAAGAGAGGRRGRRGRRRRRRGRRCAGRRGRGLGRRCLGRRLRGRCRLQCCCGVDAAAGAAAAGRRGDRRVGVGGAAAGTGAPRGAGASASGAPGGGAVAASGMPPLAVAGPSTPREEAPQLAGGGRGSRRPRRRLLVRRSVDPGGGSSGPRSARAVAGAAGVVPTGVGSAAAAAGVSGSVPAAGAAAVPGADCDRERAARAAGIGGDGPAGSADVQPARVGERGRRGPGRQLPASSPGLRGPSSCGPSVTRAEGVEVVGDPGDEVPGRNRPARDARGAGRDRPSCVPGHRPVSAA